MADQPSIAILVPTATASGREIVEAIAEFMQEHGPWFVFFEPRGPHEPPRVPDRWSGDGIIAVVDDPGHVEALARLGIPLVSVGVATGDPAVLPRVGVDAEVGGRLAAEHLLDAGLRRFAFIGVDCGFGAVDVRLEPAFIARIAAAGGLVRSYVPPADPDLSHRGALEHLAAWLAECEPPVGLLAAADADVLAVIEAGRIAGLRVPEDVAIVAAEHDPLTARLAGIGISAIDAPRQAVGHAAAAMLLNLMEGRPLAERRVWIPPSGVIGRDSTDGVAVADELVRDALVLIREHLGESLRVRDLARRLGVARRTLESRFRAAIDRSPGEAIRRLRVEKAARLLLDTRLPLARVAELCGYAEPRLLTAHFRQVHGVTPTVWRRDHRVTGRAAAASRAPETEVRSAEAIEVKPARPTPAGSGGREAAGGSRASEAAGSEVASPASEPPTGG